MDRMTVDRRVSGHSHGCKQRRRYVLAVLIVLMVVLLVPSPALAVEFADAPVEGTYYYLYMSIQELASHGIIGGYTNGNFGPGDPVLRQQFAKMIVGTGGYPVSESDICPFGDVENGGPATFFPDNFVAVCAANGITTGTTPSTFDPWGSITRYQVASMVVRAVDNLQPGLLTAPPSGWTATGGWGKDPTHGANAARAESNGLLLGLDLDGLNPYEDMTRGEVAIVLHNMLGMLTYWSNSPRGISYLGLNVQHPALDDVMVRQALSLAIDRQAIVDGFDFDAIPATGFVPPSIPGYAAFHEDLLGATAQVSAAQALLADAGYPGGVGLPEIEISISAGTDPGVPNAIKQQWATIGVRCSVVQIDPVEFFDYLAQSPDLMAYRVGYLADFNDPHEFFIASGFNSWSRFANAAYFQAVADAVEATSDAERWTSYGVLEEMVCVDQVPIIPLYWH